MTKFLRYEGEFLSRKNVHWKVELWQEASSAFPAAPALMFPADSPLRIEWGHTDKEEPVCGSTATLRVISPGDRTFEDLYTIRAGSVLLRVFRNGGFYWNGTLDPEFYEEPYSMGSNYDVELTFSDFGILDRIPYALSGIRSLQELVEIAMDKACLHYGLIEQGMITTSLLPDSTYMTLADLSVHSENFYDEDGKPNSLKEVLEAVLQPLALRMVQRGGKIWVYDLNGLYTVGKPAAVEWVSDDQMMGTDKVVNNAVVTFSPYAQSESLGNELEYLGVCKEEMTNLGNTCPSTEPEYYTYYPDYDPEWDYKNLSFTIFLSRKGSGLKEVHPSVKYFKFQPLLGGQESEGIAWMFYTGGHGDLKSGRPRRIGQNPRLPDNPEIMIRTGRTPVQQMEETDRNHYLKINMEMFLDMRYNPFTQKGGNNEGGNYELADYRFNYVQIPFTATLYNEEGTATWHYDNSEIYGRYDLTGELSQLTQGKWVKGAADIRSSRLSWYNNEDRHHKSGVAGWQSNRHNIGLSLEESTKSFKQLETGQYLPYPPEGGYLEIVVYGGVRIWEWTTKFSDMGLRVAPIEWYEKIRWLLFKAPTVNVVNANITHSENESDDIEYSGVVNEDAKDPLELDTICGTSAEAIPSARGILLNTVSHTQVKELTRAGRTTQAEQLLIGTIYSQFADRKTLLTGTAQLLSGDLRYYTERMQPGKRMICLSDCQDAIADESEIEIVEFRPDEYKEEQP